MLFRIGYLEESLRLSVTFDPLVFNRLWPHGKVDCLGNSVHNGGTDLPSVVVSAQLGRLWVTFHGHEIFILAWVPRLRLITFSCNFRVVVAEIGMPEIRASMVQDNLQHLAHFCLFSNFVQMVWTQEWNSILLKVIDLLGFDSLLVEGLGHR